ncbi:hypothetical protein [Paenibacillus polymyxa]|uniref:hypothetical protein n=1 Tax=Paenibacillus polymyxa TaxID=1406 RepID=UPI0002FA7221|nr:hypothetical protein [Paenibacillus polymyxa]
MSVVEIRSAIEKTYLEYNSKTKGIVTELQPNEEATQAAAKKAVSSLAAQVTAILSQATGTDTTAATPEPEKVSNTVVQAPLPTE